MLTSWKSWAVVAGMVLFSAPAPAADLNQILEDAATVGDVPLVTAAIQGGADVQATDSKGWTALAYAARYNQPQVANLLMNAGARPWSPDQAVSPLMLAVVSQSAGVIAALSSRGLPPVPFNDALALAAGDGDQAVVGELVKASELSSDNLDAVTGGLAARLHVDAGSPPKLAPELALLAIKLCRDSGFYSTDKCLSKKLSDVVRTPSTGSVPPQECDRLAQPPWGRQLAGVEPVYRELLQANRVISACKQAIESFPNEPRFLVALARVEVGRSNADAIYHVRRAEELRSIDATYFEGEMYFYGDIRLDYAKAGELLGLAANEGSPDALALLGEMYLQGKGVNEDRHKSNDLLRSAAAKGSAQAMVDLGLIYESEGKSQDALHMYEQAAETGSRQGLYRLGHNFLSISGWEPDPARAVGYLTKAAALGDPDATTDLGTMNVTGVGVARDLEKAKSLFETAVSLGSADAAFRLGNLYYYEDGLRVDDRMALQWFKKAADLGSGEGGFMAGSMTREGKGTPPDEAEARVWFRKGVNAGNPKAMYDLAIAEIKGQGGPKDYSDALALLEKCADAGMAEGFLGLGYLAERGLGEAKDIPAAKAWYQRAADLGDAQAKKNLVGLAAHGH